MESVLRIFCIINMAFVQHAVDKKVVLQPRNPLPFKICSKHLSVGTQDITSKKHY